MTGVNDDSDEDEEPRVPLIDRSTQEAIIHAMRGRGIAYLIPVYRNVWPNGELEPPQHMTPESLAQWLWAQDRPKGFQ